MKKTLEDVTKKKHKHCKDKYGFKRKNNEVWKAKDGKNCICHVSANFCSRYKVQVRYHVLCSRGYQREHPFFNLKSNLF